MMRPTSEIDNDETDIKASDRRIAIVTVVTAGIYSKRPVSGWDGHLAFHTHSPTAGNTFGTTLCERMIICSNGNVGIYQRKLLRLLFDDFDDLS